MDRRERSPESSLWATEAGRIWLIRLLVATVLVFGLTRGVGCRSIPDVFPLSPDLAKSSLLAICGRLRYATRDLAHAQQRLEGVGSAWRQRLSNGSCIRHPWRLADSTRQISPEVAAQLRPELEAMETLLAANGLPRKQGTVDKVRQHLAGIAALVDVWWQTVHQALTQMAMPPQWTSWADEVLLPLMSWQEPLRRTRCPGHKAQIMLVLQAGAEACERHACPLQRTAEVLAGWQAWAGEHARAFRRVSSAVEGRTGSLSQMQHHHCDLPLRRYQVWTVLHHFDGRAAAGTTPASRFFRRSFPDLCEHVLSQIDALPMPRQRRQALAAST